MRATCCFCGRGIETNARSTLHKVIGFEKKRAQGGANMIHVRTPMGVYACSPCIDKLKHDGQQLALPT